MHTGYTLIQPYVFLTLNSLLTNEHLLSSPADLFCYEFSGDVSLKFVASPYTELIIGQRPDGSCRIFCIRTADEPLILKLSGFSYCFGVRFDESLYYRLPGHPFPFPADLLQTISMSDSDIFSGTVSFSERIQRFLSALNKTGKTPACPPAATLIHQSIKKLTAISPSANWLRVPAIPVAISAAFLRNISDTARKPFAGCYAFTILFMKFFRTRIAITPNLSRKSAIPTRHIFSGNSKYLWAKHRAGSAAG